MKIYPEVLIRDLLGPVRGNLSPFVYAVYITADLLFQQRIKLEHIHFTRDVYSAVANLLEKNAKSTARQIERVANRCQDQLRKESRIEEYLGKDCKDLGSPSMMIVYMAIYAYTGKPYYTALAEHQNLIRKAPDTGMLLLS